MIERLSTYLFSTVLLSLVLGFGLFFDHLADTDEARRLARWAVDSRDHGGRPFLILDKARGRVFAFDSQGQLRASTAMLVKGSTEEAAATLARLSAGRFEMTGEGLPQVPPDFVRHTLGLPQGQHSVAYVLPLAGRREGSRL